MIRSGRQRRADAQEVVERDVRLERIALAFHCQNVGLLNAKLSRILDDYNPFLVRNCLRQDIEQSSLSGSRSATNKDGFAGLNLVSQEFGKRPAQGAASDEVVDREPLAGELPDRESGRRPDNRRNDCRYAAPIRKLGIEQWIVFIEPLAKVIGDHLQSGPKSVGIELNAGVRTDNPVTLVPPRMRRDCP